MCFQDHWSINASLQFWLFICKDLVNIFLINPRESPGLKLNKFTALYCRLHDRKKKDKAFIFSIVFSSVLFTLRRLRENLVSHSLLLEKISYRYIWISELEKKMDETNERKI